MVLSHSQFLELRAGPSYYRKFTRGRSLVMENELP